MDGVLYRPAAVDRNGDPVDANGNVTRVGVDGTLVGAAIRLIPGAANINATNAIASTEGQIGFPANGILPKLGDTLIAEGVRYRIGPGQWGRPHSLTGSTTTARYRWHQATALIN